MGRKFIPRGDSDFKQMARIFSSAIASEPARFGISVADSGILSAAYERYAAALQSVLYGSRSREATLEKDQARAELEKLIRRCALLVKAAENVGPQEYLLLGMSEGPAKRKAQTCPQEPPRLKFEQALHKGSATPMHELSFSAMEWGKSKPAGAVRLELFVDLIPPEEPIPGHPGANLHSRPWYLRSYTRSPIVITPPMTRVPMRVVYWGRWADSKGNVGPFSATAEGWIEGGAMYRPALAIRSLGNTHKPPKLLEDISQSDITHESGQRDTIYRVVMLEAQMQSFQPQMMPALPQREEPKQLESPRECEAA